MYSLEKCLFNSFADFELIVFLLVLSFRSSLIPLSVHGLQILCPILWVALLLCVLVAQSCLTLCDPMNCSPPGSSVCGISQVRILAWVAISSSRGSSPPRDQTQVSFVAGRFSTVWATRGAPLSFQIHIFFAKQKITFIGLHMETLFSIKYL